MACLGLKRYTACGSESPALAVGLEGTVGGQTPFHPGFGGEGDASRTGIGDAHLRYLRILEIDGEIGKRKPGAAYGGNGQHSSVEHEIGPRAVNRHIVERVEHQAHGAGICLVVVGYEQLALYGLVGIEIVTAGGEAEHNLVGVGMGGERRKNTLYAAGEIGGPGADAMARHIHGNHSGHGVLGSHKGNGCDDSLYSHKRNGVSKKYFFQGESGTKLVKISTPQGNAIRQGSYFYC